MIHQTRSELATFMVSFTLIENSVVPLHVRECLSKDA